MPRTDSPLAGEVACVDLETTGGHALRDRVIEAAVVLMRDGQVVEEWSALVNPGRRIPRAIQAFTGISDEMVADAPPFAGIADELWSRLEGRLFVAHNARFDYGFLRSEFRRLGRRLRAPVLCTVRLSRALTPDERGHNLDAVMERHGIECKARHRALGDAQVLARLLQLARERWPAGELDGIVTDLLRAPRLPPQLDPGLADELPEGPGVYLFLGEGDALLYVGKAKNLASRVLSHFGATRQRREQEIARLVRRVEWIETAGEFGALLAEARLIKERRPLLNKRLRASAELWAIALEGGDEALRARVVALDPESPPDGVHGLFRRRVDAQRALDGIVRDAGLCARALGLEPGEGGCIGWQLDRCRGACVGAEPAARHALRARLALSRLKLRDWPFTGRIAIRERDWRGLEEIHVFDSWRYLGTASGDRELVEIGGEAPFDPDLYRLLLRFLERPSRDAELLELDR